MKAGISLTNAVGAKANLDSEIRNWDFDKVHANAFGRWNKTLSKIKISCVTAEEKKVFYTELYHTMIDPRSMQDINGNYTGADHLVHHSKQFTILRKGQNSESFSLKNSLIYPLRSISRLYSVDGMF